VLFRSGILFEEESLNTFRPDSEFILSVMFLIAQGESEKRSAAIKKAYQWRCDAQDFLTPTNALLGYTKDEDGSWRDSFGDPSRLKRKPENIITPKRRMAINRPKRIGLFGI
jgi:hypothetical protein